MKYLHHIIIPRTSSILTSSASVELPVFSLCFLTMFMSAPLPIDIVPPVCPLKSQCTPYEASTHHLIMLSESAFICLFMFKFPFRYISSFFSFPQLSLSGFFTLFVRNNINSSILVRACLHRNSRCATVWCNFLACSSGSNFLLPYSLTVNRLSPAGEAFVPHITSGNSSITLCRYLIMDTIIVTGTLAQSISIPSYSCTFPRETVVFGPYSSAIFMKAPSQHSRPFVTT